MHNGFIPGSLSERAQAGHDKQESVAWRLAKAWSFVTDTITIACSAGAHLRVAKAMEITFAFGSLFLERELSKMWWRASCLPIQQPTKKSFSSSSSLSTCCGLVRTGDGGTETEAESIAGVYRLRSSKRRFQMTLS